MLNRMCILLLLIVLSHNLSGQSGQYPAQLIVANGGEFEFMPPFVDYVTLGKCDINLGETCNYTIFDTVFTQSVQDSWQIDNGNYYVAAENKLLAYDPEFNRIGEVDFPESFGSFKDIYAVGNQVFAGKWYGPDVPFLYVYQDDLTFKYPIEEIEKEVKDLIVKNDIVYVAQNIQGTIDACPPYGCYTDSLGYIAKVDALTGSFLGNIDLGASGAGTNYLYADEVYLYSLNLVAETISYYRFSDEEVNHYPLTGLRRGIDLHEGLLYYLIDGEVNAYNVASQQIEETNLVPGISGLVSEAVFDSVHHRIFIAETDYSTYGKIRIGQSGTLLDSIDVGISPEALTIRYEYESVGVQNALLEQQSSLYPNPVKDLLFIQSELVDFELDIFDSKGRHIMKNAQLIDKRISVEKLNAGLYFLRIQEGEEIEFLKFVKAQ